MCGRNFVTWQKLKRNQQKKHPASSTVLWLHLLKETQSLKRRLPQKRILNEELAAIFTNDNICFGCWVFLN